MRSRWLFLSVFLIVFACASHVRCQQPGLPAPPPPGPQVIMEPPPNAPPPPKIWSGSVELGANGAAGNSELYNMRVGGEVKRKTADHIFAFDWIYRYATANGDEQENRALLNGKSEWLLPETPWSCFVTSSAEYDEFKAFDVRLAKHAGVGYELIANKVTQFKASAGLGASQEIGGPDDDIVPEALFGLTLEHKISKRQKLVGSVDYFPDVSDFSNYRINAKLNYELLVDPDWNLTLKVGVLNRYDSTPLGRRPNDIEYFAVLMWGF